MDADPDPAGRLSGVTCEGNDPDGRLTAATLRGERGDLVDYEQHPIDIADGSNGTAAIPTLHVAPLHSDSRTDAQKQPASRWQQWADDQRAWLARHKTARQRLVAALGHALVAVYLVFAVLHWRGEVESGRVDGIQFCDGLGFLIIVLCIAYFGVIYYALLKPLGSQFVGRLAQKASPCTANRWVCRGLAAVVFLVLLGLLLFDIGSDVRRLASLLGVVVFFAFGFAFSRSPRQVRWQPVLSGLCLQFLMGLLTLRFPEGREALECVADKVAALLRCANEGSTFVFGKMLVIEQSVFAFQVLPVVFFFGSLINVLYYLSAMQWVVSRVGGVLQALMGTTVCESVNAAGSVFLGMTESPLLIKPYIESLTSSELHAVMGTGFATASGSVLAGYISFGADPGHLLTASVMSATGALAYAKLLLPETEESKTTAEHLGELSKVSASEDMEASSVIDAAARGASTAINIVLNIAANLVAFVSLLYLVNSVAAWLGALVGLPDFSFEFLLGKLFIPVVWLMGVDPEDCEKVATLVGLKTVVNEFVAFQRMGELKSRGELSPRSLAVTTLVLCGFSNLSSLAILMSVLSAIAPSVRTKVSDVALRALVCGIVTCCITASIGGMLMPQDSFPASSNGTTQSLEHFNFSVS